MFTLTMKYLVLTICGNSDKSWRLKAIAHWVWNFRVRFPFFSYSSSFPIKMHATDAKTQKVEPDLNFFMTYERFGGSV